MLLIELGLFSSTIKTNILFGKDYDEQLFESVVQATALDTVDRFKYTILNIRELSNRILANYHMERIVLSVIKEVCYLG